MFKPMFNQVLVEVDNKDKEWGGGNNDNLGGEAYREGTLLGIGRFICTSDYPDYPLNLGEFLDKHVMWNEGHEAGKTFEEDGKLYALVSWWDLVGYVE